MDYRSWKPRLCAGRTLFLGFLFGHALMAGEAVAEARISRPILIGLDADMTVLKAGEAIRRGIVRLVHLLHRAIEQAGTIDRDQVRRALETLGPHRGLVRSYEPAFTPKRHDALDVDDFGLFRFSEGGAIVPMAWQ